LPETRSGILGAVTMGSVAADTNATWTEIRVLRKKINNKNKKKKKKKEKKRDKFY
jgi:hypothetical protein